MPIGVPRIIYCWGEELPAQWTDIYNFIFRRRMVFLMQYLDDELCNQICGLLINIHMEDRSKELEKKEIERSGLFKSGAKQQTTQAFQNNSNQDRNILNNQKSKIAEDLLSADEDLGIEQNEAREQYTLQKITMEWLNWNAQFFDYSDEPYLFYLAELLEKDFSNSGQLFYNGDSKELASLMHIAKMYSSPRSAKSAKNTHLYNSSAFDLYSPFKRLSLARDGALDNFNPQDYNLNELNSLNNNNINPGLENLAKHRSNKEGKDKALQFLNKLALSQTLQKKPSSEKALGQRRLRREYNQEKYNTKQALTTNSALNYLDFNKDYNDYRDLYRKQTASAMQEEESKKVFMIINSFGGSVGNGITVHDALQFIKAGSLTLALGVAASAASLALAGGTIGERYVTEGCHVMIHQPEGGLQGQASDIWIDSQEIMKIRLDVAEIYSLSTYRPRHKILRDLDRDFYLTATETIYYGLADEIATNEVMHEIIEMTSKVWDYHDSKQQRLLESRESATAGLDTQTQS